jgi:hypothetical protein
MATATGSGIPTGISRDFTTTYDKTEMPSVTSVKFFLPCDETGVGITEVVDAVSSGIVTIGANTPSGGAIKPPNDATNAFSETLPAVSGSFALMLVMNPLDSISTGIIYGVSAGEKVEIGTSGSSIVGADGTASLGNAVATTGIRKYLVLSDTANDESALYQAPLNEGLVKGTPSATAHGIVTPSDNLAFNVFTVPDIYGIALVEFSTASIPSDFIIWADTTMAAWGANSKVFGEGFTSF